MPLFCQFLYHYPLTCFIHTDDIKDSGNDWVIDTVEVDEVYCKLPIDWIFTSKSHHSASHHPCKPVTEIIGSQHASSVVLNSPATLQKPSAGKTHFINFFTFFLT